MTVMNDEKNQASVEQEKKSSTVTDSLRAMPSVSKPVITRGFR